MHRNWLVAFNFLALLSVITGYFVPVAAAADYKSAIDEKAKELEQINNQIQTTHDNLNKIASQKQTLNTELKRIDYTISQVDLGIKASEINIQKLNLELNALGDRVGQIGDETALKKKAIVEALQKIHQQDRETPLLILLKNESLVTGAFEVQALSDIQNGLSVNVAALQGLRDDLNKTIEQKGEKKDSIQLENENLKIRKSLAIEQQQERKNLLAETKNKEQVYQAQLTDLGKKQDEVEKEIEQLEYELRGRIDAKEIPSPRKGLLEYPVPGGVLTQGYGYTRFASVTYRSKYHNGLDIGNFLGAEIVAADDGIVVAVGDQDRYCRGAAYGKYIVIKHHNGLTTLYGHLSRQIVTIGQEVKRGELIGYMGKTGWATGPHLHFTVYDSNTYYMKQTNSCGMMPVGGDINPNNYL